MATNLYKIMTIPSAIWYALSYVSSEFATRVVCGLVIG